VQRDTLVSGFTSLRLYSNGTKRVALQKGFWKLCKKGKHRALVLADLYAPHTKLRSEIGNCVALHVKRAQHFSPIDPIRFISGHKLLTG